MTAELDAVAGPKQIAGFVYFIAHGQWTKIGRARDVEQRLRTLQSATPIELHLIAAIPSENPAGLERALHHRLKDYRIAGEWYDLPSEVITETLRAIFA